MKPTQFPLLVSCRVWCCRSRRPGSKGRKKSWSLPNRPTWTRAVPNPIWVETRPLSWWDTPPFTAKQSLQLQFILVLFQLKHKAAVQISQNGSDSSYSDILSCRWLFLFIWPFYQQPAVVIIRQSSLFVYQRSTIRQFIVFYTWNIKGIKKRDTMQYDKIKKDTK